MHVRAPPAWSQPSTLALPAMRSRGVAQENRHAAARTPYKHSQGRGESMGRDVTGARCTLYISLRPAHDNVHCQARQRMRAITTPKPKAPKVTKSATAAGGPLPGMR